METENITIYEEVENLIRKTYEEEETNQDKEFFLKDISRLIQELYGLLE